MTETMPSFTGIPTHMIILSVIEGIWHGKEDLGDDVVLKIIQELDTRGKLGGFNKNKTKDILHEFLDERMNGIGG